MITSGDPYSAVSDVVTYSYEITNSGNVTLAGPFSVTDDRISLIPDGLGPLAPGSSVTVAGSYEIKIDMLTSASERIPHNILPHNPQK